MDFAILADGRVKLKEREKRDKFVDLAREQKKKQLSNMNVTVIPIAIGTVTKGSIKGLES